jgi:dihydrofolate reductase
MSKLIVSTWMTLDGIFDADSMNQWFSPYDSEERQEYIRDGILSADAILFGRTTYEMLAPYWSSLKNNEMGIAAKLNSVAKFVVSSTLEKAEWNNSTIIKGKVAEEITRLKQLPGEEIQIEGSATLVHSLAETDLIDEYRFLVHPVIIGSGKRFFKDGMHTNGLRLVKTKTFDRGVVLLCYQPARE